MPRDLFGEVTRPSISIGSGDGGLRYGEIIAVIDASKGAGVNRVGIITTAMRRPLRQ